MTKFDRDQQGASETQGRIEIVPLGCACMSAHQLRRCGYLQAKGRFPFEALWGDFAGICRAIESGFEDFISVSELEVLSNAGGGKLTPVRNRRYQLVFSHDFLVDAGRILNLPQVAERYDRRIARFHRALSGSLPVLFVVVVEHPRQFNAEACPRRFAAAVASRYTGLNYRVLLVNEAQMNIPAACWPAAVVVQPSAIPDKYWGASGEAVSAYDQCWEQLLAQHIGTADWFTQQPEGSAPKNS